jgi:hypothetical protein
MEAMGSSGSSIPSAFQGYSTAWKWTCFRSMPHVFLSAMEGTTICRSQGEVEIGFPRCSSSVGNTFLLNHSKSLTNINSISWNKAAIRPFADHFPDQPPFQWQHADVIIIHPEYMHAHQHPIFP